MLQLGMQVEIRKNSLDFKFAANLHELVDPCEFEFAPSKLDPTRSCQPISGRKLYLPFFNSSLCKKVLQSELVVLQQRQMKTKNTKYTPTHHSLHLTNAFWKKSNTACTITTNTRTMTYEQLDALIEPSFIAFFNSPIALELG